MILFIINKNNFYDICKDGFYTIPDCYGANDINEGNIQLISWNEARYTPKSGSNKEINTVKDLFDTVLEVAKKDPVCQDMNEQFKFMYKKNDGKDEDIDIFNNFDNFIKTYNPDTIIPEDDIKFIFKTVYECWPHPMIGNVANSPGCRPQTHLEQFINNWFPFPSKYMHVATKRNIDSLIQKPNAYGLKKMTKSGRDQCRICKDWTELARAIIGEISSYVSKLLEKIYALELCQSEKLLEEQRKLLKRIATEKVYKYRQTDIGPYTLKELFEKWGDNPLIQTEYLKRFFTDLNNLSNKEAKWVGIATVINAVFEEPIIKFEIIKLNEEDSKKIESIKKQCTLYPPGILCAMLFSDIKKYYRINPTINSIEEEKQAEVNTNKYFKKCKITDNVIKDFIPKIRIKPDDPKNVRCFYLGGCMRAETNASTITNRQFLMPLWAGPSGHANGILAFYNEFFNRTNPLEKNDPYTSYFRELNQLANVLLPTMFAFWRLYYDKRISSDHTLAETYDAIFYTWEKIDKNSIVPQYLDKWEQKWNKDRKNENKSTFNLINNLIEKNTISNYEDCWDTIETKIDSQTTYGTKYKKLIYGLYSPVGVMYRIYKKHYDSTTSLPENIKALKTKIENLETHLINNGKLVIQWSKNICGIEKKQEETATNILSNLQISRINIPQAPTKTDTSSKQSVEKNTLLIMAATPSEQYSPRLQYIFDKVTEAQTHQTAFTFERNEDFNINPPPCLTDAGIVDFVGGMAFNISEVSQTSDSEISYQGTVNTQSDCWNRLKIFGLQENQPINCTVSENNDSLMFQGEIRLDGSFSIGNISLSLDLLTIESSLDSDYFSSKLNASINHGDKTLAVTLYLPLYSGSIDVYGEYEDGNVFTITDLLTIFGLNNVIDPTKILPASEEIFGNLGLQSLHLNLSDSFQINQIGFVITTEKPWSIIENKISITPVFEIDIDNPFDATSRNIYCVATGRWFLGEGDNKSEFDVSVTSDLTIYAGLAQGSVLHLDEFVNLFAQGVSFPSITFTDLSLMADFNSNNYSFSIAAEDIYTFKVGNAELGIEGVSCSLDFLNGSFGQVSLSGSFKLGEMDLNVYGSYKGDNTFTFNADAFSDSDYSLGQFITDIAGELSYNEGTSSFPEEYLTVNIRNLNVSYDSSNHKFIGDIDLDHVLEISSDFAINDIKLHISSSDDTALEFLIQAHLMVFGALMTLTLQKNKLGYSFEGKANFIDETGKSIATVKNILESFKIDTNSIPDFICEFYVKNISAKFEIQENNGNSKKIITLSISTSAGDLTVSAEFGQECNWNISYKNNASVNVLDMDVVGELVKVVAPNTTDLMIGQFEVDISSKGLFLKCNAFGTDVEIPVYQSDPKQNLIQLIQSSSEIDSEQKQQETIVGSSVPVFNGTVVWKKFEPPKTIFILTIPKIGLGMDGKYIAVLLDASLNVSPLTFSLNEAGIGVALSEPISFNFYLSGFAVSFDNGVLSIAGGLSMGYDDQKNPQYSGLLSIRFKEIGLTAIGQYTKIIEDGKETAALCACFALLAPLGGIPAFFVKGIAGGFGYNERLILPPIEKVNEYFLIKAAMDGFRKDLTPKEILAGQVKAENGQFFLAAGLKFTTFETIEGCMIVTASFGNDFELGLLGLAKLSVPPKVETNPIAYAELAIKASVKPFDGVFSVEAQLTNRSYILCKDCKLTGGFAAYAWFGKNDHSGDFVVTLGGYHPSYNRPEHYPIVPRLGLNWQVDSHLNINGEIYFAITPNVLMAGGKLNATYTLGPLKAWFIAYADILMKWKPFAYNISVGVLVGASYTMKVWKISKTFSVELGADLKLWGPEVQGKVHVSWFIISFTITFSEGADHSNDTLDWNEFKQTFLISPKENNNLKQGALQSSLNGTNNEESNNILSINLQGVIAQTADGIDIVSAQQLGISALSKIPEKKDGSIHIKPAGSKWNIFNSSMSIVVENNEVSDKFNREKILQNLPAALWGDENTNDLDGTNCLVKDQVCGEKLSIKASDIDLFPKNQFIQLSVLYENNIIHCYDSFTFSGDISLKLDNGDETIKTFTKNETDNKDETTRKRNNFLKAHGLSDEDVKDISLTKFAEDADNLLSESILIINA